MQIPVTAEFGSDIVADLLVRTGIDFVVATPGATFRGLHDSLVMRDDAPPLISVPTEGFSVAIAHGYAKATGRPIAVAVHDIVGLMQASMSIFNAWCDRAPILVIGATGPVVKARRRPWIDWIHTASVQGQLVRDYVKWDDQPAALVDVPESFARALTTATAAPAGPVYLCLDVDLQEDRVAEGEREAIQTALGRRYPTPSDPAPAAADLDALVEALLAAELPVIVTDYAGETESGFRMLRELAERLGAPVVDRGARFNLGTEHPLNFSDLPDVLNRADVVVLLDVDDALAAIIGTVATADGPDVALRPGVRLFSVTPAHYGLKSWSHDYGRLVPAERTISSSAEEALRALLRALPEIDDVPVSRSATTDGVVVAARRRWMNEAEEAQKAEVRAAASGKHPEAVPAVVLALELGRALEGRWTLANGSLEGWERRLWSFERHRQHVGWHGGAGLGYGLGASMGVALAAPVGTICVDIQPDGDFLFAPAGLWSLAHERLPLLVVLNNNRQYKNSVDHAGRVAAARGRNPDLRHTGTSIDDPPIDYAAVARGFGVWAEGPITDHAELAGAFARALEQVRRGLPALLDIVTVGL